MADIVKQILAKPIQLADQVTKGADDVSNFKAECAELKAKTEKLATLLRQAARASSDLYERPLRRIIDETEQALDKALTLVIKCRANSIMKRVFTIIPAAAFKKVTAQLENSIGDVTWVLAVSANPRVEEVGLPPIASNEPILCMIWEQIATLYTGSMEAKADAAASLVSLADNDRYSKLIIEEGGVVPLLRLVKEGRLEGQEDAARAIGLLARDPESVEQMILGGVCTVFAKILKEGSMKVQSVVAWAISELAYSHPKCQDHFAQNNTIRLLVSHLAFETVQEHSKYAVSSKGVSSIHSLVLANNTTGNTTATTNNHNAAKTNNDEEDRLLQSQIPHPMGASHGQNQMHSLVKSTMAATGNGNHQTSPAQHQSKPPLPQKQTNNSSAANHHHQHHGTKQNISLSGASIKGREYEDPATKAEMKAMAARALWKLCKGNSGICRSITESRALLCFAVLLEKGPEEVQYNSAMALMEICAVAEQDADLRRSAFKPNSPAAKAVVDQLLRIIEKADSDLLVPCIKAIGSLARTFRATETRIIGPLVRLLDEREGDVTRETVIALTKFACTDNYLHIDHSKAILNAGGAKHLVQLVYFGEQMVQTVSLVLLCYTALHVPDSEALAQAEVLTVIEWASKQGYMAQDPHVDTLLPEAKGRLELYQSRGSRGFH
ncbi:hypothetical protein H6P81_018467 [Aristolochia fimbriata]|uniref:DUF7792 domain-containing protein n=1 Tax=Aristolochia fimbriata TaxID=158543 RepID=A0AAV7E1G1_ARIFI|nr:hypothetical protein H6P81_018467 [Aristolochia fimbriata]